MKKNKNIASKILASFALIAILFSIISVWLSVLFSSDQVEKSAEDMIIENASPEDIQRLNDIISEEDSLSPENIFEIKENIIENAQEIDDSEEEISDKN